MAVMSPAGRWIGRFSTMFNLWKMNAFASAAFFCSKNDLDDSDGSVGMLSELGADAVKTRVLNVSLSLFSNDFLLEGAAVDCAMMLFATICSRLALIRSKTDGSVVLVGKLELEVMVVFSLKIECIWLHAAAIA